MNQYKLSSKLAPVFIAFPELDDSCKRVVDFLGVNFRVREEPLVAEMLMDALSAYRQARKEGDANIAFVRGLFTRSHEIFSMRYAAFKGEKYHVWAPLQEPIPDFEARQSAGYQCRMVDEPCPDDVTPRSAAMQMAARVLSGHVFCRYFEEYDVAEEFAHR